MPAHSLGEPEVHEPAGDSGGAQLEPGHDAVLAIGELGDPSICVLLSEFTSHARDKALGGAGSPPLVASLAASDQRITVNSGWPTDPWLLPSASSTS